MNLKTLLDTGKSKDWCEELWLTLLSFDDLPQPLPSEDELFVAILEWQDKNRAEVDAVKLRSLFRDLIRYPRMSEEFLLSKLFRESGILEINVIMQIYDEKRGEGVTSFNKRPRGVELVDLDLDPDPPYLLPEVILGEQHGHDIAGTNHGSGQSPAFGNVQRQMSIIGRRVTSSSEPMGPMGVIPLSTLVTTDPYPRPPKKRKNEPEYPGPPPSRPRKANMPKSKAPQPPSTQISPSQKKSPGPRPKTIKTAKAKTCHPPASSPSQQFIEEAIAAAENNESRTPQDLLPQPAIPTYVPRPPPVLPSHRRRSRAHNIEELRSILENAAPWEEVELVEDVFDGQMTVEDLPEGVRIYGAGVGTIIRATGEEEYIWSMGGMDCLTVEGLTFIKEGAHREKEHEGLRITSDGAMVHNVGFQGCHLELVGCDGAEVSLVTVDSSNIGIFLDEKTKNSLVTQSSFTNTTDGVRVWGRGNRVAGVVCERVQIGVIFYGINKEDPCSGNSLSDLTYTFSNKKVTSDKRSSYEQTAVKLRSADSNLVTDVKCFEFAFSSRDRSTSALWMTLDKMKGTGFISSNNTVRGLSGGPVYLAGKNNSLEDVTDCKLLEARGSHHQFINCTVDKASVKLAPHSTVTNCKFGRSCSSL